MKTLLFSDTHLLATFYEGKYKFLKKIIQNSDRVVIVGDFWEGKLISFDDFVNSDWNKLFPLLKQKHTVYVYGNHDKEKYCDKRVKLFSDKQTTKYSLKQGDMLFKVKHGNTKQIKYVFIKRLTKITRMSQRFYYNHLHEGLEHILVEAFGPKILQVLFKRYNSTLKKTEKPLLSDNEYLVCGHTHAAELDLKNHFINTGIIRHGIGQYVVINGNKIELHDERY